MLIETSHSQESEEKEKAVVVSGKDKLPTNRLATLSSLARVQTFTILLSSF